MELLNELRVALPGVQFLFAFLLIVPISQGVDDPTSCQRGVNLVAAAGGGRALRAGAALLVAVLGPLTMRRYGNRS